MGDEDRWIKLESIVRKVLREELTTLGFKPKVSVGFINGQWTGITPEQLSSWKAAYACDVDQELKKAAAWLTSNKQPKNHGRFLNAWLSRCSDRSLIRSIPTRSDPVPSVCSYCSSPATGSTGGYKHCSSRECFDLAMGGEKPRKTA